MARVLLFCFVFCSDYFSLYTSTKTYLIVHFKYMLLIEC